MENNELEELKVEYTGQDERLEQEIKRSNKLRKIAFNCKAEILKRDKENSIAGNVSLLLILVAASIWATEWIFPMYKDMIHSQEALFWSAIVTGIVGCVVHLVYIIILHRKLRLKEALHVEVTIAANRFFDFKKNRKTGLVIGCIFGGLFVILACCWFFVSVTLPEFAAPIIILTAALISVIAAWIQTNYLRKLSTTCDEIVALLKV